MSKIALEGNASGTGTLTIAAPNTSTDRTLTLPDNTGTVLTSASSIAASQLPAGSVLQVVSSNTTSEPSTTGDFPQASGITLAITPLFSSSKILVLASIQAYIVGNGTNTNRIAIYGIKNNTTSTTLQIIRYGISEQTGSTDNFGAICLSVLDSPASTSSQTYEILFGRFNSTYNNTVTIGGGFGGTKTSITLMEIAA